MRGYGHINKEYLNEVEKLKSKSTSRSFLKKRNIFRWILLLVLTTVIMGSIAILVIPVKYSHIVGVVVGVALIIGIAAMVIKGRNLPETLSKEGDIVTHPSFSNMSCNVWHKDNDTNQ